ncbi:hypothetical protein KP509_28G044000 [Ceratopteris richardii]|uniref:Uncharacterized protein n=1 Tax=Ceratopteris richardii TaxID=49495 RepID=A0A8T2RBM8_CERRI|nr:hypothetical protein KP509_28G044000 [Ceratopteris richardii]
MACAWIGRDNMRTFDNVKISRSPRDIILGFVCYSTVWASVKQLTEMPAIYVLAKHFWCSVQLFDFNSKPCSRKIWRTKNIQHPISGTSFSNPDSKTCGFVFIMV